MNQKTLNSIMRLFALVKQFNPEFDSDENSKEIVKVFLSEYTNPSEISVFSDIFEYHKSLFQKKEHTTKRLLLFSTKATIICTNIAVDLSKKVRIHIIISLLEILNFRGAINRVTYDLVKTLSSLFHIGIDEFSDMLSFVDVKREYIGENILVISGNQLPTCSGRKNIIEQQFTGELYVLFNRAAHTMFFYHQGGNELFLRNGNQINPKRIYIFKMGGIIENFKIQPLFFGTLQSQFGIAEKPHDIELKVDKISYIFPDGVMAIHPVSFSIKSGEMVGVMGNSGTGKSTLLNVLAGTLQPTSGRVLINGHDWYGLGKNLFPYLGFVPQDDVLIKELTVYQNLFFTAQLCFQDKSPMEIARIVISTLDEFGLDEIKDLKVGTPEKSIISGGQRKRLNIALELIRKPQILFIDEPTSGLSSTDSDRIIDLIKNQTQKGKIALVNIHQPSSSAFKIFDKILILDQGGRTVFFGNPIDAILHLKTSTFQVNSLERECQSCGNVDTEQILNIIEQRTLRTDGMPTDQRKYTPESWYEIYLETINDQSSEPIVGSLPKQTLGKTSSFHQLSVFLKRDFISTFADKQFMLISLFEAPIMAFMLAFLAKNFGNIDSSSSYSFFYNQNIPAYFLMSVIVAMFFGLMFGAERIIKDRHIIQREKFLGLSRFSYINSKLIGLIAFLTIQVTLFVLIGNEILLIKGISMWLILLSITINAGILGLNLSSGLRTSVAIYISIPLLLMPQLLLNGSLIQFDRLHKSIASHGNVPFVANLAISRWGYEALIVNQFISNPYERIYFDIDKQESQLRYMSSYLIPEIEQVMLEYKQLIDHGDKAKSLIKYNLVLSGIKQLGGHPKLMQSIISIPQNKLYLDSLINQLQLLKRHIAMDINNRNSIRDKRTESEVESVGGMDKFIQIKEKYSNESVRDLVLSRKESLKIVKTDDTFLRKFEPVFKVPESKFGSAHLFSAYKRLGNWDIATTWFNLLIIWGISAVLYIALYFDWLKKIISFFWGK